MADLRLVPDTTTGGLFDMAVLDESGRELISSNGEFNYDLMETGKAEVLKQIGARLQVRKQRFAEEYIAIGNDLMAAKEQCKQDGTLFNAWCESNACGIPQRMVQSYISVAREFGEKSGYTHFFEVQSFDVIRRIAQTKDDDVREALTELATAAADEGRKLTKQEVTELKKAANAAKARAETAEGEAFDAKKTVAEVTAQWEKDKQKLKEETEKKDQYIRDLIEGDRQRKAMKEQIAEQDARIREATREAEDYFREQLKEQRELIREEERKRPRTSKEEDSKRERIAKLRKELEEIKEQKAKAAVERQEAQRELRRAKQELKIFDKAIGNFAEISHRWQMDAWKLLGSVSALSETPMTEELRRHIESLIDLSQQVADGLKEKLQVQQPEWEVTDVQVID